MFIPQEFYENGGGGGLPQRPQSGMSPLELAIFVGLVIVLCSVAVKIV